MTEKEKKRPTYLRLVPRSTTAKEEKENQELLQEVQGQPKYNPLTKLLKFWGYRVLLLSGAATMGFMCARDVTFYERPRSGYLTEDLDHNGVQDWIIVRQDGHKVPLYGVEKEGKVIYYTSREMRRWFRITVDYDSIESRLNE